MIVLSLKEQFENIKDKIRTDKKEELLEILSQSKYNYKFYEEVNNFLKLISPDDNISRKDFNNILAESQINTKENRNLDALQKLLTNKLKKINESDISNEEKISKFLNDIIGEQNIKIIERYIEDNTHDFEDKFSAKSRHSFLNKASNQLVIPIIAGGMGGMGLFNFLVKGGIDKINNNSPVLDIPGTENIIQAIIILTILFIIKGGLKYKINHNNKKK